MEKKRRRKVFIISLHGDLLFEKKLLERLIAENGNRVLVNKNEEVNIYAENVFNEISDELLLFPLYFDDELCMEIDTEEELELAERIIREI